MSGMGSKAESVEENGGSKDESEEGGWYDRSDHPLLNDVVLRIVFEHMKLKDIMAFREVCQKWNMSTIPITRSKWIVKIDGSSVKDNQCEETRGIEQFIQLFSKNQLGIPFGKFRLGSFCMTEGVGQEFLKLCGNLAKYIDLGNDDSFDVEDVSELLKSTPNLVKFHIPNTLRSRFGNIVKLFPDDGPKPKLSFMKNLKSTYDDPKERRKFCPTFVEELITTGENISHLTVTHCGVESNDKETQCTSLESLTVIEKLGRESSIQTLKIPNMNPELFEVLSRMQENGMKLKRVNSTGSFREPFYIQVATLFKDTLEHYSPVLCTTKQSSTFLNFPTMPHLKSLKLFSVTKFDSGCVNLCKLFPALEELNLRHSDDSDYHQFLSQSEPCPKMKSFILQDTFMVIRKFSRIGTVFPNLTELELKTTFYAEEIFSNMWSEMSQLKVLKLEGKILTSNNENLDSIFTGLSISALQGMENLFNDLDEMANSKLETEIIQGIINGMSGEQPSPSIRNLTNLSSLHLGLICVSFDQQVVNRRTYLTEMTGYFSLYSMKHIRHLKVEECQFTKTCCEILAADMGLQSWKFLTSEGVDIIPEIKAD